jgi:hypothetical protein
MSSMSDDIVNKEEVSLTNVSPENNWQNWKLPLVPQNKICKKTTFSNITFLLNYTIKTIERTYSLKQNFETIQLLSRQEIDKNIGWVWVSCLKKCGFKITILKITIKRLAKLMKKCCLYQLSVWLILI